MLAADWPGNVRELRHCLERCCILSSSPVLTAATLCGDIASPKASPSQTLADHVAASERRRIIEALAANQGRIAETAMQLGISRKNLWEKMKKHEISTQAGEGA